MAVVDPHVPAGVPTPPRVSEADVELLPANRSAFAVPLIDRFPTIVAAPEKVLLPDPDKVRLLNAIAVLPPIAWSPDLLRLMVLPVLVKVPLLDQSPATLWV